MFSHIQGQEWNHTVGVFHGNDLLVVVEIVKERSEDSPAGIEFVVTDKVRVVTLEGVEDQRLVSLGDLKVGKAAAVGEVKLGDNGLHGETGQLGVHLGVDRLVGLHTDDKLVTRNVLEDTGGHVTELDTDLGLLLVEG